MSSKILAIYDRELTETEIDNLSGVCFDMEIDEIDDDSSQRIAAAFLQEFGDDSLYKCYVFHTEELQSGMFLAGIQPEYMGRWNEEDLRKIEDMADFYENTETNVEDIGSLGSRSRDHNGAYQAIFGIPGSVNVEAADHVESQLEQDFSKIQQAIEQFFSERKLV